MVFKRTRSPDVLTFINFKETLVRVLGHRVTRLASFDSVSCYAELRFINCEPSELF